MAEKADGAGKLRRRRFSARIPPPRVKKVLQSDEEVGRMTSAVPVVLSRAMEHFAEKLLLESARQAAGARTLTPVHMKQAVQSNPVYDRFLHSQVSEIPDSGSKRQSKPLHTPLPSQDFIGASSTSSSILPSTSGASTRRKRPPPTESSEEKVRKDPKPEPDFKFKFPIKTPKMDSSSNSRWKGGEPSASSHCEESVSKVSVIKKTTNKSWEKEKESVDEQGGSGSSDEEESERRICSLVKDAADSKSFLSVELGENSTV